MSMFVLISDTRIDKVVSQKYGISFICVDMNFNAAPDLEFFSSIVLNLIVLLIQMGHLLNLLEILDIIRSYKY